MKIALVLGDKTKTFAIGKGKKANEAADFYASYLISQEHTKIFTFNQTLFEILNTTHSSRVKQSICQLLVEHAYYKVNTEPCPYKRQYFAHTAMSACMQCQIQIGQSMQYLQQALLGTQDEIERNFDLDKAKAAGLYIAPLKDSGYDAKTNRYEIDATKIEVENLDERPIIEQEKFSTLNAYTHKFFNKRAYQTLKPWRPYAQAKLPEEKRRHDIRYLCFPNSEQALVQQFSEKLKKHGFTANIQASKEKLFLSTDLTQAEPQNTYT